MATDDETPVEELSAPASEPSDPQKRDHRIVERSLAGGYTGMGIACGILFFLPWVQLSCEQKGEKKIGYTQTGMQIASGELQRSDALQEYITGLKQFLEADRRSRRRRSSNQSQVSEIEKSEQKCAGFPGLWAFPAGVVLIVLAGLVHTILMPGARPTIPFLGAAACALAIGACEFVDLPIEKQIETRIAKRHRESAEYDKFKEQFRLERLPAYKVTMGLTGGMLLLVFVHYGMAAWKQRT